MMADKRVVVVIAESEADQLIGFAVACYGRKSDGAIEVASGSADGRKLTQEQFKASKEETDRAWRAKHPHAEIIHLELPVGMTRKEAQDFAKREVERRVIKWQQT